MIRPQLLLALAVTAALAGCGNKNDHTIVVGPDGVETNNAAATENLANVKLPPSITASKIYRCRDNSVLYVDWLSDGSARVRKHRDEVGTGVQVGDGQPISGTPEGMTITYQGQSCKA